MNYRWRLEISASKFLQKIQICDKQFKMIFTIIFSVSKIEIFKKKLAKLRLGAQSVTLLSTLRYPMQLS